MVGALLYTASSGLGILHPSQLLHCRLSLIADDVMDCRVVFVELPTLNVANIQEGTIYSGYNPFRSGDRNDNSLFS